MDTPIKYADSVSWQIIMDHVFVFEEATQEIYVFKGLTKDIWLRVEEDRTISNIVNYLRLRSNRYDAAAIEKTAEIIKKLEQKSLVERMV